MFKTIKTSKRNRERVALLTRKLNLGSENIIARLAMTYSLSMNHKLEFKDLSDSQGKEYSKSVLFGDLYDYYTALVCSHYNIYRTDKDLPKYFKLHIDDGLELISQELENNPNLSGFDYLIDKVELGLAQLMGEL